MKRRMEVGASLRNQFVFDVMCRRCIHFKCYWAFRSVGCHISDIPLEGFVMFRLSIIDAVAEAQTLAECDGNHVAMQGQTIN